MLAFVTQSVALGIYLRLYGQQIGWECLPLLAVWLATGVSLRGWHWGLTAIALAAWWTGVNQPREPVTDVARFAPRRYVTMQVVVTTAAAAKGEQWVTHARVLGVAARRVGVVTGYVRVQFPGGKPPMVGDRFTVSGSLNRPQPAMNPGAFDYAAYLARQGLYCTLHAREARHSGVEPGWGVLRRIDQLRVHLQPIIGAGLPSHEAALFGSLILGSGAIAVPDDLAEDFRSTGLSHALAASGTQVGLLAASVWWCGARLRIPPVSRVLVGLLVLTVYLLLTGAPASMVRSTLMGGIALFALGTNRLTVPFAAFYTSVLAILIWNPLTLQDLGFQFSVLATYGLLRLAVWQRGRASPGWLTIFLTPFCAWLWVTPWQALLFGNLSLLALPINWLVAPLIGLVTPWGFIVTALGNVSILLAGALNVVSHWVLVAFIGVVRLGAQQAWQLITIQGLSGATVAWLYLAFLAKGHARLVGCTIAAVGYGLAWLPPNPPVLRIHVLAVGQGDALALETPHGEWVVMDGGPKGDGYDAGKNIVLPYLRQQRCRSIALVVATHAHKDHTGGLGALSAALPIEAAWEARQASNDDTQQLLLQNWLLRGVPFYLPPPHYLWQRDGLCLRVLSHPPSARTSNDGSLVVEAEYGSFRALLTGDLEREGEARLIRQGTLRPVDVLKVGHHGSKTSSGEGFLKALKPSVAIISVGASNRFGHPHSAVLARLTRLKCAVKRTDEDGAVLIETDGRHFGVGDRHTNWRVSRNQRCQALGQIE